MFEPKHTLVSVAKTLAEGLESGATSLRPGVATPSIRASFRRGCDKADEITHELQILRVDVRGKDEKQWARLRAKLIRSIEESIDFISDGKDSSLILDEAHDFKSALIDYAKSQLLKPGAEVAKTGAEIEVLYAAKMKTLAEAQEISAKAEAQALKNALVNVRMRLALTKAIFANEKGEEALLFGHQIDAVHEVVAHLVDSSDCL